MRAILLATFLMGFTAPALAYNGNQIYSNCLSTEPHDQMFCIAHMAGAFDQIAETSSLEKLCGGKQGFKGVSTGQVKDMVMAWLIASPETRHFPAAKIISEALFFHFCIKGYKPPTD